MPLSEFGDAIRLKPTPAAPSVSEFGDRVSSGPAAPTPTAITAAAPVAGGPLQPNSGLAENIAAGLNQGINATLGAPVDLARTAINAVTQPNAAQSFPGVGPILNLTQHMGIPAIPENTIGSSKWIAQNLGKVGVHDPDTVEARTSLEKIVRASADAATFAVAPETVLGLAKRAKMVPKAVDELMTTIFGKTTTVRGGLANVGANAAAGAGAEAAQEVAPDQLKPAAALLGGLVAGGGVAAAESLIPAGARIGAKIARDATAPFTKAGQEQIAANRLESTMTDPSAVRTSLAQPDVLLPNEPAPTLYQKTGDRGIGAAERGAQVRDAKVGAFAEKRNQQNAAQVEALGTLDPATASVEDVTAAVKAQRDRITSEGEANVAAATSGARQATDRLGVGETPEVAGAGMKGGYDVSRLSTKAAESGLWQKLDPNGTIIMPVAATRQRVEATLKEMPATAKPPSGEEAAINDTILKAPKTMTLLDMQALQSRVKAAMRQERLPTGDPSAMRRLTMLNTAIEHDFDAAVAGQVAKEQAAVKAGTLAPQDTIAARLASPSTGNTVYTPSGRAVGVNYEVVDGPSLIASHKPDLTQNPAYDQTLQPRDRNRAASDMQITRMAGDLQPERLGASNSTAEGAPLVGPDNMVESGNARTLAIRQAHQRGGEASQRYRQYLADQGYDTTGMAEPVLIRRRTSDMAPEERVALTRESNTSPGMAMGAGERAATDAGKMSPEVIDLYRGGDVTDAANRDFVRAFVGKVAAPGEEGALATSAGTLSMEGAQRVRNALLRSAYDDAPLVEALTESGDENIRSFGKAMGSFAGDVAKLRASIKSGEVGAAADLSKPLVSAAQFIQAAKRRGLTLEAALAQRDAFEQVAPETFAILRMAYGDGLKGNLKRDTFEAFMHDALGEAQQQTSGARLFGEAMPANQIIEGAANRVSSRSGGVASRPRDIGSGDGAVGQEVGRPGGGAVEPGDGVVGREGSSPAILPERTPNLTQADRDRLTEARRATLNRVKTFDNPVLKPIRFADENQLGGVPGKVFFSGPKSFEAVNTFRRAVGDPAALESLMRYVVDRLRKSALREDGTLDPGKINAFRRTHKDALRAMPELDAAIATAGKAGETMGDVAAQEAQRLKDYQVGVVGKLAKMEDSDPEDIVRTVGSIFGRQDALGEMRRLRAAVKGNADGEAGLRKAVATFLRRKLVGNTEAGATGDKLLNKDTFQNLIRDHLPTLRLAGFTDADIAMMERVGQSVERVKRSQSAPPSGGSATRFNDEAAKGDLSPIEVVLHGVAKSHTAGALTGFHFGGPVGGAVGLIAGPIIEVLTKNGMKRVDELFDQALLDPAFARLLLLKVKPAQVKQVAISLGQRLARVAAASAMEAKDN